jgi:hypothetical protein
MDETDRPRDQREWELAPAPIGPHVCNLPPAKDFPVGTEIICTHGLRPPEPPPAWRAPSYKSPPRVPCGIRWRAARTLIWRDPIWRQMSPGHGKEWR